MLNVHDNKFTIVYKQSQEKKPKLNFNVSCFLFMSGACGACGGPGGSRLRGTYGEQTL